MYAENVKYYLFKWSLLVLEMAELSEGELLERSNYYMPRFHEVNDKLTELGEMNLTLEQATAPLFKSEKEYAEYAFQQLTQPV